MGRAPIKINIINEASGITFSESYQGREIINVEGVEIPFPRILGNGGEEYDNY